MVNAVVRHVADLLGEAQPDLTTGLLWLFAAKAAFKGVVILFARANAKRTSSPALKAIQVDARNDALTSTLAVAGGLLDSPERVDVSLDGIGNLLHGKVVFVVAKGPLNFHADFLDTEESVGHHKDIKDGEPPKGVHKREG